MVHENGDLREVDDILRLLGNPGRFQVLQYMFLTYQYIPLAMNDLMPIFYGLQPVSVSCVGGTINAPTQTNTTLGANVTAFSATKVCGHCPDGSSYKFSYSGRQWSIVGDVSPFLNKCIKFYAAVWCGAVSFDSFFLWLDEPDL